jgi:outer membrane protein TolC
MLAVALSACSARHYRNSADREAARLIREKTPAVANMDTNFTIEPRPSLVLERLAPAPEPPEFLGPEGAVERDARVLPLLTALETAVHHSRDYQTRKEVVYLSALDLSLQRQRFTPIMSGGFGGTVQAATPQPRFGTDPVTGLPVVIGIEDTKLVQGRGSFGFSWLLNTGARLTIGFSAAFLRYLAGDSAPVGTDLSGDIVLPLLRGGGRAVTMETLTQAERNLLYDLRQFAQYRKEFAVETAASYFAVLQGRDQARNAFLDLQRSRQNAERERAFADEGLRPKASRDQLKQAELGSETRWVDAVRGYRESLDRFKISLGLPLDIPLVLDDQELGQLSVTEPALPPDEAVKVAEVIRLDLQNTKERAEDAQRRIAVAKNGLLPQIDVRGSAGLIGNGRDTIPWPSTRNWRWNGGLDVDLPLNRKAERNNYRAAMIEAERAKRQFDLAADQVRLQIATDWRALGQARRNFDNAGLSVRLAERRVEEQELRMQLGRGAPRDLLDAQADLNNARNQRTDALISHTLARLRYFRDMGLLYIRDDGQWVETLPPKPASATP